MTERPILFSGPMVCAIIDGRKTVTRRGAKFQAREPGYNLHFSGIVAGNYCTGSLKSGFVLRSRGGAGGCWNDRTWPLHCPYGLPGDRLWVREDHYRFGHWEPVPGVLTKGGRQKWRFVPDSDEILYKAPTIFRGARHHQDPATPAWHKRLARFMPRSAARILLEITNIRVERLQEISQADAIAEGVLSCERDLDPDGNDYSPYELFSALWVSINGHDSWHANPWVWVVEFKRAKP